MSTAIIHLSDIHYRPNWDENHGVVFRAFFKDLKNQLELLGSSKVYLVLSGDIVMSGNETESYNEFLSKFDAELSPLGISMSHRICVPGNHDVSTEQIELKKVDHEGVVSQDLSETAFNDYAEAPSNVFKSKFEKYSVFESRFADYKTLTPSLTGTGWNINANIGIYCLNSAFFSSGNLKEDNGNRVKDKGRLAVNTRNLHAWNKACNAQCKILVMHHPLDWLAGWAQQEIRTLLNNDFSLCLSGHAHDSEIFHSIRPGRSLVEVSAPPLFTKKTNELGYSIICLSSTNEISDITYRQWAMKHHSFLTGVNFSNTNDGKVIINAPKQSTLESHQIDPDKKGPVDDYLTQQLSESLMAFTSQPKVWVEPILSNFSEFDKGHKSEAKKTVAAVINHPRSTIIKAPPQFGLTCLAHHLIREAWRLTPASLWLYLDSRMLTPSSSTIKRVTNATLELMGCELEDVKCVILDSWQIDEKNSHKLLKAVCTFFNNIPIIVMQSINTARILNQTDIEYDRDFDVLYLWALSREHVRKVVNDYNDSRLIGDEDAVTLRVVSDLDALNIHRTPLNCLTVLKASEVDFDESPVNRTEMLSRVLFILFNVDETPTYKTRPDMKDCEFVLGYFCETLIREDVYIFTRDHFVDTLKIFCKSCVMALDVRRVFDILYANHILVSRGSNFCFKFTYWLYYFVAQRMHHSQDFTNFIFTNMYYTRFPEVVEFYTGIDRRREDALNILIKDLVRGNASVQDMCGLPDDLNPYQLMTWNPTENDMKQMQEEVNDGVLSSNLPDVIKDRCADKGYDKKRPYHQEVRAILCGDSIMSLIQSMKASSQALRNSDYVSAKTKRALLSEIMNGWKQITKVLLALSPLLTTKGHASLDGSMAFILDDSFSDDPGERFRTILFRIPANIVNWYKDDLFSEKMGPLLLDHFVKEQDVIKKHELILLLIIKRPSGWKEAVKKYIGENSKNSFYLFDVMVVLRNQYEYSYAAPRELEDIEFLIKMTAVKHTVGTKIPGIKAIKKMTDSVLPERSTDDHKIQ